MKTKALSLLSLLLLILLAAAPCAHAQAGAAVPSLEAALPDTRWTTVTEPGKQPWGDVTFQADHGVARMQGRPGKWVLVGASKVNFDEFTLTFDTALRTFTATLADGTKICTGTKNGTAAAGSGPTFFGMPVVGTNPIASPPAVPAADTAAVAPDGKEPPPEIKALLTPYLAAIMGATSDYSTRFATLQKWYLDGLDKLQAERAKAGDLDGALAVKAEHERIASLAETTPEQIKAMPATLGKLRATFDPTVKKLMDEAAARKDTARRKYLADLEVLQKRITMSGDIDKALLVKAEKEKVSAEMSGKPLPNLPPISPPQPPAIQPKTTSRFAGTKWRNSAGGTAEFKKSGEYTETGSGWSLKGNWKALSDSEAEVARSDQTTWHFIPAADGESLTRREAGRMSWKRVQ